jgi:hypothetical protein
MHSAGEAGSSAPYTCLVATPSVAPPRRSGLSASDCDVVRLDFTAKPPYFPAMVLLRERVARRGIGAVEPCLPSPAKQPPSGSGWLHEIKHDASR